MGLMNKGVECVAHTADVSNGCDVVEGGPIYANVDEELVVNTTDKNLTDILYQIMLDQKKIMFELEYLKKSRM